MRETEQMKEEMLKISRSRLSNSFKQVESHYDKHRTIKEESKKEGNERNGWEVVDVNLQLFRVA